MDGILERNWQSRQWTVKIDLRLSPRLGLRKEQFCYTVGFVVCFDGNFAIGTEDIDGGNNRFVNILNKLLNGLVDDVLIECGVGSVVGGWERGETISPLLSLAIPGEIELGRIQVRVEKGKAHRTRR